FAALFAEARRSGLHAAPHAGEAAGPASIRSALDALGAERIQHGVRAVEDLALLAELVERQIPLAVCPTSNLRLGVVPSLDAHPLRRLWDAGAIVSVNTDDPGFFASDLVSEYAIAGRLRGRDPVRAHPAVHVALDGARLGLLDLDLDQRLELRLRLVLRGVDRAGGVDVVQDAVAVLHVDRAAGREDEHVRVELARLLVED